MALIKKEDTLSFAMKIPRSLHDELDKIRTAAKAVGATYDPVPSLVKALRKDMAAAQVQIEAAKKENKNIKAE